MREELEYWLEEYRLQYAQQWDRTGRWDDAVGKWVYKANTSICQWFRGLLSHNTEQYWTYLTVCNLVDCPALAYLVGNADEYRETGERLTECVGLPNQLNWDLYELLERKQASML